MSSYSGSGGNPLVDREVQPIGYGSPSSSSSLKTESAFVSRNTMGWLIIVNFIRMVESTAERPLAVESASSRATVAVARKQWKAVANPLKRKVGPSTEGEPFKKKVRCLILPPPILIIVGWVERLRGSLPGAPMLI